MIYAGAIVMNGQDVPYKADDGNGFARVSVHTGQGAATPSTAVNAAGPPVSASLGFDPIFIGIPLLEAGQLNLADIQVGNLNQKLVATVTTNALLLASSLAPAQSTPSPSTGRRAWRRVTSRVRRPE